MSESHPWNLNLGRHPSPDEVGFDLERTLSSVVALQSRVPDDAFTAPILGTEREGQGVVISDDGLVLTIGYLVTEAEDIWLIEQNNRRIRTLFDMHKPSIAQVHGNCLAGGTDLAMACDIVIAADDARIGFPAARAMGAEKPIIVGHSWGAAVALAWALDAPDEVSGVVTASNAPGVIGVAL